MMILCDAPRELAAASPFTAVPLELLVGGSGFRGDARFARGAPLADLLAAEFEPANDPVDPIAVAWADGHAAGYAEAMLEAERSIATDAAARGALTLALQRLDAAQAEALRERLCAVVTALCETALAPLALDVAALAVRAERAVAAIARADEAVTVCFNPADLPLVAARAAAGWTVTADPALERGALRVDGGAGGIEDGPEQWRRAIAEAVTGC
jgi:flagellar assembly protein FliH